MCVFIKVWYCTSVANAELSQQFQANNSRKLFDTSARENIWIFIINDTDIDFSLIFPFLSVFLFFLTEQCSKKQQKQNHRLANRYNWNSCNVKWYSMRKNQINTQFRMQRGENNKSRINHWFKRKPTYFSSGLKSAN